MPLLVRLIIDAHPGERIVNVRLPEPPRPGDLIELRDGTRITIKKLEAPRRGGSIETQSLFPAPGKTHRALLTP